VAGKTQSGRKIGEYVKHYLGILAEQTGQLRRRGGTCSQARVTKRVERNGCSLDEGGEGSGGAKSPMAAWRQVKASKGNAGAL